MMGVSLSRWTMIYFATALAALILSEILMTAGFGFPSDPLRAPQTLVVVHLVAIGWLSLLMCGALFQFVPVLIARPLHSDILPLPAFGFLALGLCGLLAGFLQLAGIFTFAPLLLPHGAVLLAIGFGIVLYNLARTLWPARPLQLPARFVVVALTALVAVVTFGVIFSFSYAALAGSGAFVLIAEHGLALHVIAGIGGWLSFTAMGVSYRLLAMFMLAPETAGPRTHAVFWLGTVALGVTILGGLALLLAHLGILAALLAGAVLGGVGIALYCADIVHLYRARRRPIIELNSQMAGFAVASLAGCVVLTLALLAFGQFLDHLGAVVFLAAFGWLSGLGLAKLYKIVAFLTWLECYGPVLGKTATPRVQDLVVEPRTRRWFGLYYLAVWGATIAMLIAQPVAFRVAAALMLAATLVIAAQLVRIRLLSDVAGDKRFPEGVRQPHLLVLTPGSSR